MALKRTVVRLEPQFHKKLAIAMLERNEVSFQDLLTRLLGEWLRYGAMREPEISNLTAVLYELHRSWQGDPSSVEPGLAQFFEYASQFPVAEGQTLLQLVRELHAKWHADPASVAPGWARYFEEIEAAAGVIALSERTPPMTVSDVSSGPDLTVPGVLSGKGKANSGSVSSLSENEPGFRGVIFGDETAANWAVVLRRILASGYENAIDAITSNLTAFDDLVQRAEGDRNDAGSTSTPSAEQQGEKSSRPHKKRNVA